MPWLHSAYDSAMILADAMKRAGSSDGAKVRDALAATKDFDAVSPAKLQLTKSAMRQSPP